MCAVHVTLAGLLAQPPKTVNAFSCAVVPDLPAHLPGLACWDIYKAAPLDALRLKPKPQATPGVDGVEASVLRTTGNSKASRVQHATHSAGKLPASFSSNSPKEQKMLAYLADFQRVFQELYPHRWVQALFLCPHSTSDLVGHVTAVQRASRPHGFCWPACCSTYMRAPAMTTHQRQHIVRRA